MVVFAVQLRLWFWEATIDRYQNWIVWTLLKELDLLGAWFKWELDPSYSFDFLKFMDSNVSSRILREFFYCLIFGSEKSVQDESQKIIFCKPAVIFRKFSITEETWLMSLKTKVAHRSAFACIALATGNKFVLTWRWRGCLVPNNETEPTITVKTRIWQRWTLSVKLSLVLM